MHPIAIDASALTDRPPLGMPRPPRECVAVRSHCSGEVVEGSPVALCARHLRMTYEFARELVERDGPTLAENLAQDAIAKRVHAIVDGSREGVSARAAGFVYFATFGDRLKVGFSIDVDRRMINLPHDELLGAIPGTLRDEAAWHQALADYRIKGEWFRAEPEVLAIVQQVLAANAA